MKNKKSNELDVISVSIRDILHHIEALQFLSFYNIHKKSYSQGEAWEELYSSNSELKSDFNELKKKIQNETQSFFDHYNSSEDIIEESISFDFSSALSKELTAKNSKYFRQEKLKPAHFKTRHKSCFSLVESIKYGSLVRYLIGNKREDLLLFIIMQSQYWAGYYSGSVGAKSIDILAENARNAARASHEKHYKLRDTIQSWWLENRTHYKTQEKTAIAASELFGCSIDTAKKHIRAKAKELRELRELPKI